MRRISSLPTLQYCGQVDNIGKGIETTQALRSTIFHKYCESGEWDKSLLARLPEDDRDEIFRWRVPHAFIYESPILRLEYKDAFKELAVGLDSGFNFIETPEGISPEEAEQLFPNLMVLGHLDFAWHVPELDLVVTCDIKSSVHAVKERTESLQLHGYSIGLCAKLGAKKYINAIWDATDGRYYSSSKIYEIDSFEVEEIKDRVKHAANNKADYVRGTHCSGCWKRFNCPVHISDANTGIDVFNRILSGNFGPADVVQALTHLKSFGTLTEKVAETCKAYVEQHGPVKSEDGKRYWTVAERAGRDSWDFDSMKRKYGEEELNKFKKKGKPYLVYDWRNVKE